jgi:O-antigen/teichoic acid export membrane protein
LFKKILHKRYLIYGSSIIFSRGLEYIILFFAAHYLVKSEYGELEYYKKIIEVGSSVFAFGFPALITSYTRGDANKKSFFFLSVLFVLFLAVLSSVILGLFNVLFLIIPFVFYAIFFNGGILPSFLLVYKGSNAASYYKSIVSVLFYSIIFVSIYYFDVSSFAYVHVNYVLIPFATIYLLFLFFKHQIILRELKKYWRLFRKLLASSFTLVVSNFANLMFLYTDIFIIKFLSDNANVEIANYSFALNIGNMLMLIPLTLVQVDIEKLKNSRGYFFDLNKKIMFLVGIGTIALGALYGFITNTLFIDFKETMVIFIIILIAKIFHALSTLFGTNLLIFKKFKDNLQINILMLVLNIILSYVLYNKLGLHGVALASVLSLAIRYALLIRVNKKLNLKQ